MKKERIDFTESEINTIGTFVYNYDAERCTKFHALMVLKVIKKYKWLTELEYENFVGAVKMKFQGIMKKINDIIVREINTQQGGELMIKWLK